MNTAKKLMLGMLRGSGAVIPYENITDDLASDSGLWLDGNLTSAAMTIISARGVWSPTEGAELHTSANAASDPNGNEANATTGWNASQVTLSVESSDVNTGLYALKVVANDGTTDRANRETYNTDRKWRTIRAAAKVITGSSWTLRTEAVGNPIIPLTSDWAEYVYTARKKDDYQNDVQVWCNTGAASDTTLIDNVSIKELTIESQFRIQRVFYPSSVAANVWMSGYTQVGLVVFQDVNNWIATYLQRATTTISIAIIKCVAGTFTIVNGGAAAGTYSGGSTLELIPAADFQTWTVKLGGTTRIDAAAITDFAPSGTWYAGLFNTYNPSDVDVVGFDDFAATRLAGASPFESAPAEVGASATLLNTTVIRESLTEPDWFGRASVKTLSDGTTVMVYYRGTGHAENQGAIHICFSDDYGDTWTAEDTDLDGNAVAGFPMNPPDADIGQDGNEPWLVRYDDDTLLLFIWRVNWTGPVYNGTYQSKSIDNGITWTTPTAVSITGAANNATSFLTNDHFIYDSRLYCAYEDKNGGNERCCLAYTDDVGANWTHLSVILTNASEASLEYIGNDTIISILRANNGKQTFYKASTNMGVSWGSTVELTWRIPPIVRPRIKAAAHLRGNANWWEDPHLILWGGYYDSDGNRVNCVSLSKDSGATWTVPTALDEPYIDAAYGDILYNPAADTYEYVGYRGDDREGPAAIVQYSLGINWGT